jgi:hypothetical protein
MRRGGKTVIRPIDERVTTPWSAIALHTTPGIPEHMSPLVAMIAAGVQTDVRGARYDEFTAQQRDEIVHVFPRECGQRRTDDAARQTVAPAPRPRPLAQDN